MKMEKVFMFVVRFFILSSYFLTGIYLYMISIVFHEEIAMVSPYIFFLIDSLLSLEESFSFLLGELFYTESLFIFILFFFLMIVPSSKNFFSMVLFYYVSKLMNLFFFYLYAFNSVIFISHYYFLKVWFYVRKDFMLIYMFSRYSISFFIISFFLIYSYYYFKWEILSYLLYSLISFFYESDLFYYFCYNFCFMLYFVIVYVILFFLKTYLFGIKKSIHFSFRFLFTGSNINSSISTSDSISKFSIVKVVKSKSILSDSNNFSIVKFYFFKVSGLGKYSNYGFIKYFNFDIVKFKEFLLISFEKMYGIPFSKLAYMLLHLYLSDLDFIEFLFGKSVVGIFNIFVLNFKEFVSKTEINLGAFELNLLSIFLIIKLSLVLFTFIKNYGVDLGLISNSEEVADIFVLFMYLVFGLEYDFIIEDSDYSLVDIFKDFFITYFPNIVHFVNSPENDKRAFFYFFPTIFTGLVFVERNNVFRISFRSDMHNFFTSSGCIYDCSGDINFNSEYTNYFFQVSEIECNSLIILDPYISGKFNNLGFMRVSGLTISLFELIDSSLVLYRIFFSVLCNLRLETGWKKSLNASILFKDKGFNIILKGITLIGPNNTKFDGFFGLLDSYFHGNPDMATNLIFLNSEKGTSKRLNKLEVSLLKFYSFEREIEVFTDCKVSDLSLLRGNREGFCVNYMDGLFPYKDFFLSKSNLDFITVNIYFKFLGFSNFCYKLAKVYGKNISVKWVNSKCENCLCFEQGITSYSCNCLVNKFFFLNKFGNIQWIKNPYIILSISGSSLVQVESKVSFSDFSFEEWNIINSFYKWNIEERILCLKKERRLNEDFFYVRDEFETVSKSFEFFEDIRVLNCYNFLASLSKEEKNIYFLILDKYFMGNMFLFFKYFNFNLRLLKHFFYFESLNRFEYITRKDFITPEKIYKFEDYFKKGFSMEVSELLCKKDALERLQDYKGILNVEEEFKLNKINFELKGYLSEEEMIELYEELELELELEREKNLILSLEPFSLNFKVNEFKKTLCSVILPFSINIKFLFYGFENKYRKNRIYDLRLKACILEFKKSGYWDFISSRPVLTCFFSYYPSLLKPLYGSKALRALKGSFFRKKFYRVSKK